jgi:hypothetical protein
MSAIVLRIGILAEQSTGAEMDLKQLGAHFTRPAIALFHPVADPTD